MNLFQKLSLIEYKTRDLDPAFNTYCKCYIEDAMDHILQGLALYHTLNQWESEKDHTNIAMDYIENKK